MKSVIDYLDCPPTRYRHDGSALIPDEHGDLVLYSAMDAYLFEGGQLMQQMLEKYHEQEAKIGSLNATLNGWLAANNPGGWIDDLRKRAAATVTQISNGHQWELSNAVCPGDSVLSFTCRKCRKDAHVSIEECSRTGTPLRLPIEICGGK